MRQLATVIGILGVLSLTSATAAFAQEDAPAPAPATATPVMVQMPDGSLKQGYAVGAVQEPKPEPKKFAFTFNPLNLFIGRYGFNFEYQPVVHHGLIVTPHYDSANADVTIVDSNGNRVTAKDSFSGVGAELGYRFYSGERGFNGLFVSPSLLLATYKSSGSGFASNAQDVSFNSIGWAFDIGGQGQIGNFIIGGGGGFQYTKVSKDFTDLPAAAAIIAGGGWRPRFLFNIGFAF